MVDLYGINEGKVVLEIPLQMAKWLGAVFIHLLGFIINYGME